MQRREVDEDEHGSPYARALHRAVESLVLVLLDCYRYYREVPPGTLRELYILYRTARHDGLLDSGASTDEPQADAAIALLFHAIVLLSMVEPERLAEGESGFLYDVIRQHAGQCRILQGNSWDSPVHRFLLDLGTDDLPVPCQRLQSPADAAEPFLLDISGMIDALQGQLAAIPKKIRGQSPEAIVMRRLTPGATGANLRSEQRRRDDRYVDLLQGMPQVHDWLAAGHGQGAGSTTPCRVIDSSERGMKLLCEQGRAGDTRVGEIAGVIADVDGETVLRLALVRSVQVLDGGGVHAGLQLLADGAGAVSCRDADDAGAESQDALFLAADEDAGCGATLVVAGGLYRAGRRLLIDVGGREIRVRAGEQLTASPLYDRFEFFAE